MAARTLSRLRMALLAGLAASCNWPVPSCDTDSGWREFQHTSLEMRAEGTSFRLRGGLYTSCMDICAAEPGVIEVYDCEAPKPPFESAYWKVRCNVDAETCKLPAIVKQKDRTPFH